jgi:hypothetical protein
MLRTWTEEDSLILATQSVSQVLEEIEKNLVRVGLTVIQTLELIS